MKLQGKVAVVTGGGSGQGRAVSVIFAREGAKIVVADIDSEGAMKTVGIISSAGGQATCVECDVSKSEQVIALMQKTVDTYDRLDILYNNAARNRPNTPIPETVAEMPEEQWLETIQTNLTGYYYTSKYAIPEIAKRGGVIINVASTLGLSSSENQAAYASSKHGVMGLTKSLALDYGPLGIRVNAICPGSINTPRFNKHQRVYGSGKATVSRIASNVPLGRVGEPEEIATVALFLASDDSSYITGTYIPVDGGGAGRRL